MQAKIYEFHQNMEMKKISLLNTFNEHPVSLQSSFSILDLTKFAIFDEKFL